MDSKRLGKAIAGTYGTIVLDILSGNTHVISEDFSALEMLLNLFARLLPSSASATKRSAFIKDVFQNGSLSPSTCSAIARLIENSAAKDWEVTATKVLDILSKSDMS